LLLSPYVVEALRVACCCIIALLFVLDVGLLLRTPEMLRFAFQPEATLVAQICSAICGSLGFIIWFLMVLGVNLAILVLYSVLWSPAMLRGLGVVLLLAVVASAMLACARRFGGPDRLSLPKSVTYRKPSEWEGVAEVPVDDPLFEQAVAEFEEACATWGDMYPFRLSVSAVYRLENPRLQEAFESSQASMIARQPCIRRLFHGTGFDASKAICSD
ncbi:unnamed protein product, partial [Polarella glacialis]